MSDELDVLFLVAERLDAARIPYMLSGSTAMNVYAEPRMTRDIDIVIDAGDVETIAASFESSGSSPPRIWCSRSWRGRSRAARRYSCETFEIWSHACPISIGPTSKDGPRT